jgi:DNA replication protein DnaC
MEDFSSEEVLSMNTQEVMTMNDTKVLHLTEKMKSMKMGNLRKVFLEHLDNQTLDALSTMEWFSFMINSTYAIYEENRLARLLKQAQFKNPQACIADVYYGVHRSFHKDRFTRLASCDFIRNRHHVIFTSPTGCGKTWLAQALGHEACKQGFKVRYASVPIVLDELLLAEKTGLSSIWDHYLQVDMLILDDFCLHPVTPHQATLLWRLVEALHHCASLIVCSQGTSPSWYTQLGENATAEAIIDRIIHNSVATLNIECKSMSMRELFGPKKY